MGEIAREYVRGEMVADLWTLTPLDRIAPANGRGPRSDGRHETTLPDFQATKNGYTCGIEVKGKERATPDKYTGKPLHGVDSRLLDDYRVYDRSSFPTFIVLVELGPEPFAGRDTYATYAIRVNEIRARLNRDHQGVLMAYWERETMAADWLLRLNRNVNNRGWAPARARAQTQMFD
jgi:hypothetical protein